MKIGILTLPLHTNYGGNLQCYALCHTLNKMGHEVEVMRFVQPSYSIASHRRLPAYAKRLVLKALSKKEGIVFLEKKLNKERPIIAQHANQFLEKYIPFTEKSYLTLSSEDAKDLDHDAYVVGSDQVWRPQYAYPSIETFFLDFTSNKEVKRIAYAASFGTDSSEYGAELQEKCASLIQKFDGVGVREDSAIQLVKDTYQWECDPKHVLDPTMLLNKEEYLSLLQGFPTTTAEADSRIFYYILDMTEVKRKAIDALSNICDTGAYTVYPKDPTFYANVNDRIVPPVELWLKAFNDAEYIVTDSFHGCVFSILFNKPFWVFGNKERGLSRFTSLLAMFGLEDRIIDGSVEFNDKLINQKIDWQSVNNILENQKEKAFDFLKENLVQE